MSETPVLPALTGRQKKVLDELREYIRKTGYPPSVRELAKLTGLASTSSVANQLRNLQDLGYIRRGRGGGARRIEIVDPDEISPEELAQLREFRDLIRGWVGPVPIGDVIPLVIEELRRRQAQ